MGILGLDSWPIGRVRKRANSVRNGGAGRDGIAWDANTPSIDRFAGIMICYGA